MGERQGGRGGDREVRGTTVGMGPFRLQSEQEGYRGDVGEDQKLEVVAFPGRQ